ncbi:unnamed protein product [Echinostoma caproni]|uniref:Secreted protein n=1 Tax=Echinostoma caproni TaxID=27848 RepID=A0A183ARL4_9TREM|nr:unnamed protein product [Echinostoma caproni]
MVGTVIILFLLNTCSVYCFGGWGFGPYHPMMMMHMYNPWIMDWRGPHGWGRWTPRWDYGDYGYGYAPFSSAPYGYENPWYGWNPYNNHVYASPYLANNYGYGADSIGVNFGYSDRDGYGDWYRRKPYPHVFGKQEGRRLSVPRWDVTDWGSDKYGFGDGILKAKYDNPKAKWTGKEKDHRKLRLTKISNQGMYHPSNHHQHVAVPHYHRKTDLYGSGQPDHGYDSTLWNAPWFAYGQGGHGY